MYLEECCNGMLQWNVGSVDKTQANNTWEIDDNVLFVIFYWYHCPTELNY